MADSLKAHKKEFLWALIFLALGMFFLTPRFFEVGAETYRTWRAALILRETGAFAPMSLGPLYYVYLNLFAWLKYPLSYQIEYVVTFFLSYLFIFRLIRKYLNFVPAMLLTYAWIPMLAMLDGGYLIGAAFVALHFSFAEDSPYRRGFLPPFLLFAYLCNGGMVFFLCGHVVGMMIERRNALRKKQPVFPRTKAKMPLCLTALACGLIALVILFPSRRRDVNPCMGDMSYSARMYKSHLTTVIMQNAVERYYYDHYGQQPASCSHDYGPVYDEVAGDIQDMGDVLKTRSYLLGQLVKSNLRDFRAAFTGIFFGTNIFFFIPEWSFKPVVLLAFLLAFLGLWGYSREQFRQGYWSNVAAMTLGPGALLLFMLLTFPNQRYYPCLAPFGLVLLFHVKDVVPFLRNKGKGWGPWLAVLLAVILLGQFFLNREGTHNFKTHISAILHNDGWLSRASKTGDPEKVSLMRASHDLERLVHPGMKIFAYDALWFAAFMNIGINDAYSFFEIPCAPSAAMTAFFKSMDAIFVSNMVKEMGRGYLGLDSLHLRYDNILKPFLAEEVSAGRLERIKVSHYGEAYIKQNGDNRAP